MRVVIWGAGRGNIKAKQICDALNWKVICTVDSDMKKVGKTINALDIKDVSYLERCDTYDFVIIAAASEDIEAHAMKYTNRIITWKQLGRIYNGIAPREDYSKYELGMENIKNGRLLTDRNHLLDALASQYINGMTIAEIGVAFGDFSEEIIKRGNINKLFLIDAWEGERYGNGKEEVELKFKNQIEEGKIELLQGYSTDILRLMEDDYLDIAYIDTNHTYATTYEELLLCDKKVKKTGYICGHDYVNLSPVSRIQYGVVEAVHNFCVEFGYEFVYLTMESDGYRSFAIRKIESNRK